MDTEIMKNEDQTLKFLFTYLDAQKAYVNDKHPDFKNSRLNQLDQEDQSLSSAATNEQNFVQILKGKSKTVKLKC